MTGADAGVGAAGVRKRGYLFDGCGNLAIDGEPESNYSFEWVFPRALRMDSVTLTDGSLNCLFGQNELARFCGFILENFLE